MYNKAETFRRENRGKVKDFAKEKTEYSFFLPKKEYIHWARIVTLSM